MTPSRSAASAITGGTAPVATASASRASIASDPVDVLMAPEPSGSRGRAASVTTGRPARPSIVAAMLSFACGHCGRLVFFENTVCLHCGTPQGFVPDRLALLALEGEKASPHQCG